MEFRKTTLLSVYTGEDVMCNDIPLYKSIVAEARRLGLAGATVFKGIEGYAAKVRGIGRAINTFISGNANLPIIINIVDERKNIEKILPFLEVHADHALVMVEDVTILMTDYTRKREAERLLKQQHEHCGPRQQQSQQQQ